MKINVRGKRVRGRPNKRRLNTIYNIRTVGICEDDVEDRVNCKLKMRVVDSKKLG